VERLMPSKRPAIASDALPLVSSVATLATDSGQLRYELPLPLLRWVGAQHPGVLRLLTVRTSGRGPQANEGQILSDVCRRFQTLIFARDGSPIKTLTVHCHLNFKLTLIAAKDVMEQRMYKEFDIAMDNAYKDTSKE
jgi:hypothetical protein